MPILEYKLKMNFFLIYSNFMLIMSISQTDGQTYQNYSSEPHKTKNVFKLNLTFYHVPHSFIVSSVEPLASI
jgi:hypothetical protein